MISSTRPRSFNPKFRTATCFLLWQDKFLLLQRQERKSFPKQRAPPGGKQHNDETLVMTMQRELQEETGFWIPGAELFHVHTSYVKIDKLQFVYEEFFCNTFVSTPKPPKIKINKNEHTTYKRVRPTEALNMKLMTYEDRFVKRFFGIEQ